MYALDSTRLASILTDSTPTAAVVVGDNDQSEVVVGLGKLQLYRCALLTKEGSLVETDASVSSLSENNFEEYKPNDGVTEDVIPLYILYTSGMSHDGFSTCSAV